MTLLQKRHWPIWTIACVAMALATGCGGGSHTPNTSAATNFAPLLVDPGVAGLSSNQLTVQVTVCVPGTNNCKTIDHVLVDTQSTGLRLFASELPTSMALPPVAAPSGKPLLECTVFGGGNYTWGSVNLADVQVADGKGSNIEIHLLDDVTTNAVIPPTCSNGGQSINKPSAFGTNGVLGVSVFNEDCPNCATNPLAGVYYDCASDSCATTVPLAMQVRNPLYQFPTNNNGVIIQLPMINVAGQTSAAGTLILGIDTQANNQLGGATVLSVDPAMGYFTTNFNGIALRKSFIDSGTNFFIFSDTALPTCKVYTTYYCPNNATTLTAINQGQGQSQATSTVTLSIVDADAVFAANPGNTVFQNIAAIAPTYLANTFDWGLPFFFGRRVYIAFERQTTSAGTGPFVAY